MQIEREIIKTSARKIFEKIAVTCDSPDEEDRMKTIQLIGQGIISAMKQAISERTLEGLIFDLSKADWIPPMIILKMFDHMETNPIAVVTGSKVVTTMDIFLALRDIELPEKPMRNMFFKNLEDAILSFETNGYQQSDDDFQNIIKSAKFHWGWRAEDMLIINKIPQQMTELYADSLRKGQEVELTYNAKFCGCRTKRKVWCDNCGNHSIEWLPLSETGALKAKEQLDEYFDSEGVFIKDRQGSEVHFWKCEKGALLLGWDEVNKAYFCKFSDVRIGIDFESLGVKNLKKSKENENDNLQ
jgi:hypothetical protein